MSPYMQHRITTLRNMASVAAAQGQPDNARELDESAQALQTMCEYYDRCAERLRELRGVNP